MRFRGSVSIVLMSVLWMVFLCGPVQSGKEIPVLTLRESIDLGPQAERGDSFRPGRRQGVGVEKEGGLHGIPPQAQHLLQLHEV